MMGRVGEGKQEHKEVQEKVWGPSFKSSQGHRALAQWQALDTTVPACCPGVSENMVAPNESPSQGLSPSFLLPN